MTISSKWCSFQQKLLKKNLTIKLNNEQNYKNSQQNEGEKRKKLKINERKERNNTFLCKNDHFCVGPYSKLNNDAFDKWQNEKYCARCSIQMIDCCGSINQLTHHHSSRYLKLVNSLCCSSNWQLLLLVWQSCVWFNARLNSKKKWFNEMKQLYNNKSSVYRMSEAQ